MTQFLRLFRLQQGYLFLPVFLFAVGVSPNITRHGLYWTFAIVHLLVYPSVAILTGLRDRGTRTHVTIALPMLLCAIAAGFLKVSNTFGALLVVYVLLRLLPEGYGPPGKYVSAAVRSGLLGFVCCYLGVNGYNLSNVGHEGVLIPAFLAGILFPLWNPDLVEKSKPSRYTELVSHLRFRLAAGIPVFILAAAYFYVLFTLWYAVIALTAFLLLSCMGYLTLLQVRRSIREKEPAAEDVGHALVVWHPYLAATAMNGFFIYFFLDSSQILQAIQSGF